MQKSTPQWFCKLRNNFEWGRGQIDRPTNQVQWGRGVKHTLLVCWICCHVKHHAMPPQAIAMGGRREDDRVTKEGWEGRQRQVVRALASVFKWGHTHTHTYAGKASKHPTVSVQRIMTICGTRGMWVPKMIRCRSWDLTSPVA